MLGNLVVLVLLMCGTSTECTRYDGYVVLRLDVSTDQDVHVLKQIQEVPEVVDFWDFPRDLMVSPSYLEDIKATLKENKIKYVTWIDNVQDLIDTQFNHRNTEYSTDEFNYAVYHTWEEIYQWVLDTAAAYPGLAEAILIMHSYQGKEQYVLKVGSDSATPKEAIWYQGGIHAREWISPATVMWMTNQLLMDYSVDPEVKSMLDQYDIYVLPLLNVDGYNHTWEEDRMWRKTQKPNNGSNCIGTDANRNWDYMWGGEGASAFPCASTYRGDSAHSEPEVKGVATFLELKALEQTFQLFIDFHSYSQYWLTTWGYTLDLTDDHVTQTALASIGCDAIYSVHGTVYTYGTFADHLYIGSGLSQDWGYGTLGSPYSFTVELRDTGEYGFLLPEDQIIPTSEETYAGLKAAITYVMANT
ncbi:carboxypeptidase A4-like [Saccoglossus kowalevskii]